MGRMGQAHAMKVERRCEICSGPAEAHHIVSRGANGPDDAWNILWLCRRCHRYFHDVGWVKFVGWYPALEAKVRTAREMAGKHTEARV